MRTSWQPEFGSLIQVREPEADVTDEQVLRVHTREHLSLVSRTLAGARLLPFGQLNLGDSDTKVGAGTAKAARRAAGLVVAAVDDVLTRGTDDPRRAFSVARPPGHHAEADGPQG